MSEGQSLKEKTAKGLFWGGFSNGMQQLIGLVFGICISRILDASDYGMVGMLSIFSLIASTLQDSTYAYVDLEKTFAGAVEEQWRWNIGVRHMF